jgi:P-type conjugative transfer protein TrbJ
MKRYLFLSVMALLLCATTAQARTVFCVNCSTNVLQALDRVTNVQELANIIKQYEENVTQTAQQIRMVQQNVEQYANMVQNTVQLPAHLINEMRGEFTRLASLSAQLRTQRGDVRGLANVFANLFPSQSFLEEISGDHFKEEWDKWSGAVDEAVQATFQLSGQQLQDMQSDPQRLQNYIDNLLSTPEGQQQALMAGNQLTALQVQETRQLRELLATQAQSALTSQMKSEKESQMAQEAWRDATKVDGLGNLVSKPDPF